MAAEHFHGTIGLRGEADLTVRPEHTAAHESGGLLPPVLSTARLLRLVDETASALVAEHFDEGYVSVGFRVVLEHVGPSEVGDTVTAHVVLEAIEDRDLIIRFTVRDKGALREVARGTQTRRIVRMEDFMRKLKAERPLL